MRGRARQTGSGIRASHADQGLALGGRDHRLGDRLEGVGGLLHRAGLEEVAHGLLVVAGRHPGAAGAQVEDGGGLRLALGQAAAQEGVEEVVVAVPAALGLDDEQVGGDQVLHHVPRVGPLRHDRGEGRGEALEHRGVEQEALHVGGEAAEDLLGEVVEVRAPR